MSYAYNVKRGKRAAKASAAATQQDRQKYGEAYIHMTPLKKFGVRYRAFMAEQNAESTHA